MPEPQLSMSSRPWLESHPLCCDQPRRLGLHGNRLGQELAVWSLAALLRDSLALSRLPRHRWYLHSTR